MHAQWLVALAPAAAQHSDLGARVIVKDYVSGLKGHAATVVIRQFMLIVTAGAGVFSVLRMALGAQP